MQSSFAQITQKHTLLTLSTAKTWNVSSSRGDFLPAATGTGFERLSRRGIIAVGEYA